MEKEFIPYDLSLKLKVLGFDEPCVTFFFEDGIAFKSYGTPFNHNKNSDISRPTFSQAFRWFRDALDLDGEATRYNISKSEAKILSIDIKQTKYIYVPVINGKDIPELENMSYFLLKEEAELACLEKLIEIVEFKKQQDE